VVAGNDKAGRDGERRRRHDSNERNAGTAGRLTAALEDGLVSQGHGDDDISALARAIRQLSGM
jgi:hypothetical protein